MKHTLVPVILVIVALAAPLIYSVHLNHGHFVYTLDDPYIHLSLASEIARGHHGINPGEATSPSSSILWPFLLVPFTGLELFQFVPLLLNTIFAAVTAIILYRFFDRRLLPFIASVFAFSIPGLVLTGMEHGLQVLLTASIAVDTCRFARDGTRSSLLLPALVAAPLVRYECLAVSVPVLVFLFVSGERKASLLTGFVLAAFLAGYSLFLMRMGLDPLPASVMAKSTVAAGGSALSHFASNLATFRGAVQALLLVPLSFVMLSPSRKRSARLLAGTAIAAALLHLAVGRFGWFHRYGVYAWTFTVLVTYDLYRPFLGTRKLLFSAALCILGANYLTGYLRIPHASANIYRQQYQMARFAREWYPGPIAVNDLGLVAFMGQQYVLDLWGLAVPEALEGASDPEWVDSAAVVNGVDLAIVYAEELPGTSHWTPVARMDLHPPLVVCPYGGVDFLAAPWSSPDSLKTILEGFAVTVPDGIDFTVYHR